MENPNFIDVAECARLTRYSKSWIYLQSSKGNIPKIKKSRKLLFNPDEIIQWMKAGEIKSSDILHVKMQLVPSIKRSELKAKGVTTN